MTDIQFYILVASMFLGGFVMAFGTYLFEKGKRMKKEVEVPLEKSWVNSQERVVVEIGDFVNRECIYTLKINGQPWRFNFREAEVGEYLSFLGDCKAFEKDNPKKYDRNRRLAIFNFLKKRMPKEKGEKELKEMIDVLPPHGIDSLQGAIGNPMTNRALQFAKKKTQKKGRIQSFLSRVFSLG